VTLLARNAVGAREGDRVVVGVSESGLLGAALAVYLVPILALLAGAGLGTTIGGAGSRAWPLLGAAIGLLLALRWLARYSARLGQDPERAPVILRRLGAETAPLVAPPGGMRRAG
jgi:sigma-E factor negative regulatory protein RseC